MYIKELTNAEFNLFTDSYPYFSIYQTSEYGFIMNTQNYTSLFLGLIDDNKKVVAASLILIEKEGMFKYAYAPKGFLIDYNNKELVKEFTKLVQTVEGDVRLSGKDEYGSAWEFSAKSALCVYFSLGVTFSTFSTLTKI